MLSPVTVLLVSAAVYAVGYHHARRRAATPEIIERAHLEALMEADLEPGCLRDLRFLDGADAVVNQLERHGVDVYSADHHDAVTEVQEVGD